MRNDWQLVGVFCIDNDATMVHTGCLMFDAGLTLCLGSSVVSQRYCTDVVDAV